MKATHHRSHLEIVAMRERTNRLLRRVSRLVQNYDGDNVDDAIIGFCTENTFADCMFRCYAYFLVSN